MLPHQASPEGGAGAEGWREAGRYNRGLNLGSSGQQDPRPEGPRPRRYEEGGPGEMRERLYKQVETLQGKLTRVEELYFDEVIDREVR